MSKKDLFIKLANPDKNGISRWVKTSEFVGEYASLYHENGGSWSRSDGSLCKQYILEKKLEGNKIVAYRLNGFNTKQSFNQSIRKDIKDYYKDKNCVMLGVNGSSANVKIQIDHKDGRKNDDRISNKETQKLEDFQPLCTAANTVKRQICKRCKKDNKRWDAKNIKGNPYSFYLGDENYNSDLGCVGCYQYDPVEYRKTSVKKISKLAAKEAVESVFNKLYPEE
ncbi:MAG: hypothetical protein LBR28_02785 [Bacteroidales bacterium]|jgi:hypothetical protein|nr:hypothetical protein [Bacteroidales bacterium]